jgi:hypothetical protein
MKIFNFVTSFLIVLCIIHLIIGTPLPVNTLEIITVFLVSILVLGLNVQYLNKQDKIKKGKR